MFKTFSSLSSAFEVYMTNRGRSEAHRILLSQSDNTLQDIGIDRHELQGGVQNWPWDGTVTRQARKLKEQANAIADWTSGLTAA